MALEGKHTFGHDSQNGSSCNNHPHKSSHMTVSSLNILGLRQNLLLFDEAYLWLRGRQVLFQDAFSSIRRQQISPKFLLRPPQHPRSPTGQQPWVLWTIWWYFRAFGVIKLTNKTNAAARNRAVMENLIKTSTNREKPGTSRLIVAGPHGTNHGTVRVKVFTRVFTM